MFVYICLPTYGRPFYQNNFPTERRCYTELSKDFEFIIHPTFVNNLHWKYVSFIITRKMSKAIIINDNGMSQDCVNVATVVAPHLRIGGCPHLWGDIYLKVKISDLEKFNITFPTIEEMEKQMEDEVDETESDDDCPNPNP